MQQVKGGCIKVRKGDGCSCVPFQKGQEYCIICCACANKQVNRLAKPLLLMCQRNNLCLRIGGQLNFYKGSFLTLRTCWLLRISKAQWIDKTGKVSKWPL